VARGRLIYRARHTSLHPETTRMAAWRVELDLYCGPLDLLLYLVRRDELDVRSLPIARITKQFETFISVIELLDLDVVGEFVVMASSLAEIKSRLVLPSPEDDEPEAATEHDDPRSDLIRQLLEYRRYRDAASALEEHAADWQERYPRLTSERPRISKSPADDLIREVELWDLVSALARVLEKKVLDEKSSIRDDDTPIAVHVERIGNRVRAEHRVAFTSLFDDATNRSRIVAIFLAILELLRHHAFRADQADDFGEIWVLPPLEETSPDASEATTAASQ